MYEYKKEGFWPLLSFALKPPTCTRRLSYFMMLTSSNLDMFLLVQPPNGSYACVYRSHNKVYNLHYIIAEIRKFLDKLQDVFRSEVNHHLFSFGVHIKGAVRYSNVPSA